MIEIIGLIVGIYGIVRLGLVIGQIELLRAISNRKSTLVIALVSNVIAGIGIVLILVLLAKLLTIEAPPMFQY